MGVVLDAFEAPPALRFVARALGLSEPTVSRRLTAVRELVRRHLVDTFGRYSFTAEEWEELSRNGLGPIPNKDGEAFDQALAQIYHRVARRS